MERFIVGVDGSNGSEQALRWARSEARIRDATVTAVLVWDLLDQYHADGGRRFDPHYDEHSARTALDAAIARALGDDADDVGRHVVCDLPVPGLLDAAEDADLLVVGARGLGGFRGLVTGSVSQRCLEHASCPVAVVRGPDEGRGRVVVGVDGSDGAVAALHWAVEEARLRAATLTVVHGWEVPYAGEMTDLGDVQEACGRAAIELVDHMVEAAGLDTEQVERRVVHDAPVQAIADAAEGADLVVVGSRGRGGFTGLLLGSVSHQVSRHSDRPVVVVPETGP
jgi:nucleotide-binding universal stress UspA family protein